MSKKRKIVIALFYTVVFLAFLLIMGVRKTDDTESYYKMASYREPLYGILLRVTHGLFKSFDYYAMGLLQNGLAIWTSYCLSVYTIEKKGIQKKWFQALIVLIVLSPYVLSIFFTTTHVFVPNAMMSEGITVPLYNLLVVFFLQYIWEEEYSLPKRMKLEIKTWITMFLILMIRGQLLFALIVWLIMEVLTWIKIWKQNRAKSEKSTTNHIHFAGFLLSLVLMLGCKSAIVGYCNYVFNGIWIQTTYTSTTFVTNLLYYADFNDGEVIQDEDYRGIFEGVFYQSMELEIKNYFAPKEFDQEAEFFAKAHDVIKMDIYQNLCLNYLGTKYPDATYEQKMFILDDISTALIKDLMPVFVGRWMTYYWKNVLVGLIRSVIVLRKWSYIPAISIYGFVIFSAIYLYRQMKKWKKTGKEEQVLQMEKTLKFFLLVVILTAGCVSSVSLMIMCLSRYMVYNIALIYLATVLLAREIYLCKKMEKN